MNVFEMYGLITSRAYTYRLLTMSFIQTTKTYNLTFDCVMQSHVTLRRAHDYSYIPYQKVYHMILFFVCSFILPFELQKFTYFIYKATKYMYCAGLVMYFSIIKSNLHIYIVIIFLANRH